MCDIGKSLTEYGLEGSGAAARGKNGGPTELRSATMVAAAVKAGSKEPCAGSAAARLYILASMQLCACATTWHDGQTPDGKQSIRSHGMDPQAAEDTVVAL